MRQDVVFAEKIKWAFTGNLIKGITTPTQITPPIKAFCNQISSSGVPVYISVNPFPWSRKDCCTLNVKKVISESGGTSVLGYKIWANQVYAEAESHCVWKNTGGQLIDITFNPDGENTILFVEDLHMTDTRLASPSMKPRIALDADFELLLKLEIELQKDINFEWGSDVDTWNNSISYEQWCKDK